ncbi:PTS glucose/sucrose transporter subunit IIB, partial [Galactobacillus timonensis]|uniref:PTS glucose/sucrose transporter subunit IIB n=1 Tax=Galactobacillus timonensis TaxID=2041840 RepID=UPI0024097DB8
MNAEAKKQLASQIITNVGGKENITTAVHCMTRLRLNVKDKSQVNADTISKLKNVIGAQWSGDQFQVIIGQEVGDVYKEVIAQTGLASEAAIQENLDDQKKKFSFGS